MAHSKNIIIKCPACSAKFEAEREEESTFISCPDCNIQVKISGTEERRSRAPRRIAPTAAIPSKRSQERVRFSDLSSGASAPIDLEGARKRAQQREQDLDLIIDDVDDDDEELVMPETSPREKPDSSEVKPAPQQSILRRAAKLEERAAKLEERAAKLSKLKVEREIAAKKALEETEARKRSEEKTADAKAPSAKDGKADGDTDKAAMEKVEVRSSGERRRLRRAPKADVPEPRGRPGAPRYVDDLRVEKASGDRVDEMSPTQAFDERKISEDATWRRHQAKLSEAPDWESDEDEEEPYIPLEQRRHRMIVWSVFGVLGLFALFASYQFILTQIGWLTPVAVAPDAPPLPQDTVSRWSRAEMLEKARPVIEGFLSSTSNEQALQYVRRAGKVGFMMKKHYLPGSFQPVKFNSLAPADECLLAPDGVVFIVPITLADFSERPMAIWIPDGIITDEWLIDWESWEGYSEMRFSEMRLRKPKDPVLVRCFIIQDEYYNFNFSDKERYLSFKIFDHNREAQLWAYVDRKSDPFRKMVAEMAGVGQRDEIDEEAPLSVHYGGVGEELATIRVRYLETSSNPSSDQVEITEFVTLGWVVRE